MSEILKVYKQVAKKESDPGSDIWHFVLGNLFNSLHNYCIKIIPGVIKVQNTIARTGRITLYV